MKSRLASFIMSIVIMLIIAALILLGMIFYQEFSNVKTASVQKIL